MMERSSAFQMLHYLSMMVHTAQRVEGKNSGEKGLTRSRSGISMTRGTGNQAVVVNSGKI
jgi:hypothetical protein